MNYLLVNYEYPPMGGGAGNAAWFLARALVRRDRRVTVLTARHRDLPNHEFTDGVEVVRAPSLRRHFHQAGIHEMASFAASASVLAPALAKKKGIGRVIVFFTIPGGPVGLYLKWRLGLPYIVLQRGGDVPGFEPRLDRVHRLLAPLRRRLLEGALFIAANDRGLAEMSRRADPFPVTVVPNGVDVDFWRPAPARPELGRGPLRCLAVGRLVGQKNLFYLLDEFAQAAFGQGADLRLTVVGDGPERRKLEDRAARLNLQDCVSWRGWLSKTALREEYRQADCLLNPSLYEGMPNVVLEAMACGAPAVVSNVPGNNTLVEDGLTGHLCELNGRPSLADRLVEIYRNPERLAAMSREARRLAAEQYSWDTVAESYERLFEAVPENPGKLVGAEDLLPNSETSDADNIHVTYQSSPYLAPSPLAGEGWGEG
jgi:glycosyltransferase involved in cell wall biosynthesis